MPMDDVAAEMTESSSHDEQQRLKEISLGRDGHQGIVTGICDIWDKSAQHLCPPAERANCIGDIEMPMMTRLVSNPVQLRTF
jgi:hypothetical protein